MQYNDLSVSQFSLRQAIDCRPLTVTSDTQLTDTIAMMGKARASCVLPSLNLPLDSVLMHTARASCVLVLEGLRLVGVFSVGNAVRVIASGRSLQDKVADVVMPPATTLTQSDDCDSQDVFTALSLLRQQRICHLPVLDQQDQVVGIITPESIYKVLQPAELLQSRYLAEVMTTPVICAPETASVLNLAQLMVEHQVNCVVLVEAFGSGMPVGIVTEHDIVQLQTLELDLSQTPAHSIVSPSLLCFSPSDLALVAQWEMQQQHVQSLVVSHQGDSRTTRAEELLGIVTPTSFLQTLDLTEMSRAVARLQLSINQFKTEKAEFLQDDNPDLEPPGKVSATAQDQLEPSRLLNAIALRIRESLNLNEILSTAVVEVRQLLQTDRVVIYRFNPDLSGTVVVESVAPGWHPALGSTVKDTCFGKDYAQSYKEGRIQVTEDIYASGLSQCHIDILTLFDVRANLVFPIVQGEHLWGLLCAYQCSGPRYWRQLEIDLLSQLATHIAIALQQAELYGQLQSELSERKRVEEALRQSEEETRRALEKEQELNELKSHFVTMTSHEFRTPLSTILYSTELIQKYGHKLSEKEKFQELQQIQITIKRMTQLLDDVLLVGKAEAGKLEFNPTPLDLSQFCRNLLKEMQLSASHPPDGAHTMTFRAQGQCKNACMDEKLLRHILSNLLSNAIKYSPQGGAIHFELICQQGDATFSIQDEGIGIPIADQSQLFNVFHRASNVNKILGTGLGLAIVKKSVDLHGGQITFTSEVGVGTTFKIVIPLHNQISTDDQNSCN